MNNPNTPNPNEQDIGVIYMMDPEVVPHCDFCGSPPDLSDTLETDNFRIQVGELTRYLARPFTIGTRTSSEYWMACGACHEAIQTDDYSVPEARALAFLDTYHGYLSRPQRREALRFTTKLHAKFRANRIGQPIPVVVYK